ncbi:helix-turn-helix transcriptional regulator [Streptomyces gardneri]|uniref:helix-turn-helix domain-containing protein n=1 Tax=Nocardia TaxID=1817 RepID=UPI00135855D8|nr:MULTISPECIES: helix-turn-helix transcriptional regulator [Nocardia]MBF6168016.1 helix-turn-helix transcriptional regulator [Streptomyces gardneri]MBF6206795.1 helix-turn-helix transcriptional regulator [Streptomyces gardneri]
MTEHPRLHSIPGGRDDRPRQPEPQTPPEPLWREVLGEQLRTLRQDRSETLVETAKRAGISPQYLSEVERGRKEPSSEMIAALAGSLGTTLGELTGQVADELRARRRVAFLRRSAPRSGTGPTLMASAA